MKTPDAERHKRDDIDSGKTAQDSAAGSAASKAEGTLNESGAKQASQVGSIPQEQLELLSKQIAEYVKGLLASGVILTFRMRAAELR